MALDEPFIAGNFALEMDKAIVGSFGECSGLEFETEVADGWIALPGGRLQLVKVPVKPKYTPITMKRPIDSNSALYTWYQKSLKTQNEDGKVNEFAQARGGMSVIMYDVKGQEKIRWTLVDAWVGAYKTGALDASKNETMKEEVKIHHHGMKRISK